MPNLNLTYEELDNLFVLLSVHSTASAFNTFGVYEKVEALVKPNWESGVSLYNRNWEARQTLRTLDNGLIEFEQPAEPEPEEDPDNPFLALLLHEMAYDNLVERIDQNSFRLTTDDKSVVITLSEPEVPDDTAW